MLNLYNSRTRQKEPFIAGDHQVGLHVCGRVPTSLAHLGHAFTQVHFDVLARYLRHLGQGVIHVLSLGDIDPDLLDAAKNEHADWRSVSERNAYRFLTDMHWLGNQAPSVFPRTADLIPDIITHIKTLLERRCAYLKNGSIYFDITAYNSLGTFDQLQREQWMARIDRLGDHPDRNAKKNPLDFLLWKSTRDGGPAWDSPWGLGYPGWHAQFAATALKFFGPHLDISGGSADFFFPHHECTAAQYECLSGRTLSGFWVHTGLVTPLQGELPNPTDDSMQIEALRHHGADTIRISILDHHYAQAWLFDPRDVRMAGETDELFRQARLRADGRGPAIDPKSYEQQFFAAMNDNLDTPRAMGVLRQAAIDIMRHSRSNAVDAKIFLDRSLRLLGLPIGPGAH